MKKIYLIVIMLFFTLGAVQAQESSGVGFAPSSYYTFSWTTTFTMGDFNDWVGEASPAGFEFAGKYFINADGVFAGWNIGWQRVSQIYDHKTYTIPDKGIAITAKNYRFTWMVPFQAMIGYHLRPDRTISPYAGLGIGGDYMEHHLMVQEYDIYEEVWDFALAPEIGATAKFGNFSQWGATLALNYRFTTNKIEFYETKTKNLQMLNLKVGLSFIIR